jgi:hypothetical protein
MEKAATLTTKMAPVINPISFVPDVSVAPILNRRHLTSKKTFCFCGVSAIVETNDILCNKIEVPEIIKWPMFREMSIVIFTSTAIKHLHTGLGSG